MKNRKGFTLVELVAVIIILGVLLIIAIPAVSQYIKQTRETTYASHETAMTEATRAYTIDCLKNNEKDCSVPHDNESINVYLDKLIEKEYVEKLQDPVKNGSYCSPDKSYVKVTKDETTDYKYQVCLFCSGYSTSDPICKQYEGDSDFPTCGTPSGVSSAWTREPRTITIGCSDQTSGCTQDFFSKTFRESTNNGQITIIDRSGRSTQCSVPVRVDVTAPTCKIIENTTNRTLPKLTNVADAHSGVATYGIGTSANTPDYNKKDTVKVGNGATRVYGYVKDNAGNEGVCSKTVVITGFFTIKYDANGGTGTMGNTECFSSENCTVRSNTFTKTNAKFKYWTTNKNGTGIIVHDHETKALTVVGDQLTLYAQWDEKEYVHSSAITFNGTTFINTGMYLFSSDNYKKDFEMKVKIEEIQSDTATQSVIIGDIDEKATPFYGTVIRPYSSNINKIQIVSNSPTLLSNGPTVDYVQGMTVVARRVNDQFYYSEDGGTTFKTGANYSTFTDTFDVPATLGARIWPEGKDDFFGLDRFLKGKVSNVSIKYLIDERVIIYDSNGGNPCSPDSKKVANNTAWGTLCTPTRTGYTFAGWNTKADGTGTNITSSTVAKSSYVVYAKWTINSNTLVVNADGGTGGGTFVQNYNTTKAVSTTKTGHTFSSWTKTGTCNTIGTGSSFTYTFPANKDTTCTIKANWTINQNTLTVDANGGTGGGTWKQNYNTTKAVAVSRTGYTFSSWTKSGTCNTIGSGTSFTYTYPANKDTTCTIKANWTINQNTLTVDANSGTGGGTWKQNYNTTKAVAVSRTGYTFSSWTKSGTCNTIGSGSSFTYTYPSNKDTTCTIKAGWTINQNTLTVDANGGSGGGTWKQNYNTTKAVSVSRTGYDFNGWTKSGTCNTIGSGASFTYTYPSNKDTTCTIKAGWTIHQNTLTVNANSGSGGGTWKQNYNTTKAVSVSRTGYTFSGWTKSGTCNTIGSGASFTYTFPANKDTTCTIKAGWNINSNKVVINANGGSGGGTWTRNYGSKSTASVSRSDHSFSSWSKSGTCGTVSGGASVTYTHPANSGTTCTLTANWTYNPPPSSGGGGGGDSCGGQCWCGCCCCCAAEHCESHGGTWDAGGSCG